MTKTTTLGFRIDPELKKRLQELADADRRSLSAYIEIILENHIKAMEKAQ